MMWRAAVPAIVLTCVLAGCSEAASPVTERLVGVECPEDLGPTDRFPTVECWIASGSEKPTVASLEFIEWLAQDRGISVELGWTSCPDDALHEYGELVCYFDLEADSRELGTVVTRASIDGELSEEISYEFAYARSELAKGAE